MTKRREGKRRERRQARVGGCNRGKRVRGERRVRGVRAREQESEEGPNSPS